MGLMARAIVRTGVMGLVARGIAKKGLMGRMARAIVRTGVMGLVARGIAKKGLMGRMVRVRCFSVLCSPSACGSAGEATQSLGCNVGAARVLSDQRTKGAFPALFRGVFKISE